MGAFTLYKADPPVIIRMHIPSSIYQDAPDSYSYHGYNDQSCSVLAIMTMCTYMVVFMSHKQIIVRDCSRHQMITAEDIILLHLSLYITILQILIAPVSAINSSLICRILRLFITILQILIAPVSSINSSLICRIFCLARDIHSIS